MRYLQAKEYFYTVLGFQICACIVNLVLNILFVFKLNFGYLGVPLAITCTNLIGICSMLLYLKVLNRKSINQEALHFFNSDSFQGWSNYLSLSAPAILMGIIEGGGYELLTIYAGILGVNELAANTIIANLHFLTYTIPIGISAAAATLIGQEVGQGNQNSAKLLYKSTYLLAVVIVMPLLL